MATSRAQRTCRGPDRLHPTRANVTNQRVQSATSDEAGGRSYLPTPSSPRLATKKPRGARVIHRLTATVLLARRRRATSLQRIAHVHRRGASSLRRLRSARSRSGAGSCDHATTCNAHGACRCHSPQTVAVHPRSAPHHARAHTTGHRRVSPAQTTTPAQQRLVPSMIWVAGPGPGPGPGPRLPLRQVRQRQAR